MQLNFVHDCSTIINIQICTCAFNFNLYKLNALQRMVHQWHYHGTFLQILNDDTMQYMYNLYSVQIECTKLVQFVQSL